MLALPCCSLVFPVFPLHLHNIGAAAILLSTCVITQQLLQDPVVGEPLIPDDHFLVVIEPGFVPEDAPVQLDEHGRGEVVMAEEHVLGHSG